MRKRLLSVAATVLFCLLLTGCIRWDMAVTINDDGSIDLNYLFLTKKEFAKNTDKLKSELQGANFSVQEVQTSDMRGYQAKKHLAKAEEFSGLLPDDNTSRPSMGKISVENTWFTDVYHAELTVGKDGQDNERNVPPNMKNTMQMVMAQAQIKVIFHISGGNVLEHNATRVLDEGKTYEWDISLDHANKINFSVKMWNWSHVGVTVGIALLVALVLSGFAWSLSNERNSAAAKIIQVILGIVLGLMLAGMVLGGGFYLYQKLNSPAQAAEKGKSTAAEDKKLTDAQQTAKKLQDGLEKYKTGAYDEAIALFNAVLEKGANEEAYLARGHAYRKKGMYAKAAEDYGQVIKLNGISAEGYYYRGICRLKLGDLSGNFDIGFANGMGFNPPAEPEDGATEKVAIATHEYKRGRFNIEYPYIEGLANTTAQNKINAAIKDKVDSFISKTQQQFDDCEKNLPPSVNPNTIKGTMSYEIMTSNTDMISLCLKTYAYFGGTHGGKTAQGCTFDLKTGNLLHLGDIYSFDASLRRSINQDILQQIRQRNIAIFEPFRGIDDNPDFYIIKGKTPVIIFREYQIAPYSSGILEFPLSSL